MNALTEKRVREIEAMLSPIGHDDNRLQHYDVTYHMRLGELRALCRTWLAARTLSVQLHENAGVPAAMNAMAALRAALTATEERK